MGLKDSPSPAGPPSHRPEAKNFNPGPCTLKYSEGSHQIFLLKDERAPTSYLGPSLLTQSNDLFGAYYICQPPS